MHVNPEPAQCKTLWPLPGGSGSYLSTLSWLLERVQNSVKTAEIVQRMVEQYNLQSHKAAASYLRVPHTLGLIEIVGESVYLTAVGREYLRNPSPSIVRDLLGARVSGCTDIVGVLQDRPRRIGPLTVRMRELGHTWTTDKQVRYRLRWLEEVGVVERVGGIRQPEYRVSG